MPRRYPPTLFPLMSVGRKWGSRERCLGAQCSLKHREAVILNRDAARRVATKTTRADMTMREITTGNGGLDRMRACGGQVGGGIFAKTAKTPPLQSGVCGDFIAIRIAPKGRPLPPPCAYHAIPHASHLWRPYGFYNDAARRVATVFE